MKNLNYSVMKEKICKLISEQRTIILATNTGENDLVVLTVVVER